MVNLKEKEVQTSFTVKKNWETFIFSSRIFGIRPNKMAEYLVFCQKEMINYSVFSYLSKSIFVTSLINTLLFSQKLTKFRQTFKIWVFLVANIFKRAILLLKFYLQKSLYYYFAENQQNLWLIVKIWTFLVTYFLKCATFLDAYVIISWRFCNNSLLILWYYTQRCRKCPNMQTRFGGKFW